MSDDPEAQESSAPRSWRARFDAVWSAAAALLSTRAQIFREELAEKRRHLGRAGIAIGLAVLVGSLALVLLTALVAALLVRLFGSTVAGLLAAFLLYAAVAATAAWVGSKALSRVRPLDFPLTRDGLVKDWEAIEASATFEEEAPESAPVTDFEERVRAGSE